MLAALFLAAALAAPEPRLDTVHLMNGGRLRGTVVEDTAEAVMVQLPDGTFRRVKRGDVARIDYEAQGAPLPPAETATPAPPPTAPSAPPAAAAAEGATAPAPAAPAPQAPAAAPPPAPGPAAPPAPPASPSVKLRQPARRPAPPAEPPPWATPPPEPAWRVAPGRAPRASTGFQMALGVEGVGPFGRVTRGGPTVRDAVGGLGGFVLELGGKPHGGLFLGGTLRGAFGGGGRTFAATCNSPGVECINMRVQLGVVARFHGTPWAARSPWLALEGGVEAAGPTAYQQGTSTELADASFVGPYAGLSAGLDFRLSPELGLGPYLSVTLGNYSRLEGSLSGPDGGSTTHGWIGGLRMVIFP
jgi:hypothetical protein